MHAFILAEYARKNSKYVYVCNGEYANKPNLVKNLIFVHNY